MKEAPETSFAVGRIPTRKFAGLLQQNQTAADTDKVLVDLLLNKKVHYRRWCCELDRQTEVKEMKKLLLLMLVVGMMVFLTSGYGMASSGPSYYAMGNTNGVKYLTGGVGLSERAHLEQMAKNYDLKLVFADPAGAYLANVQVDIRNSNGASLIQRDSNGPWFYAELPAGQYTIIATHDGKTETRKVVVGKTSQEEMFRFKA